MDKQKWFGAAFAALLLVAVSLSSISLALICHYESGRATASDAEEEQWVRLADRLDALYASVLSLNTAPPENESSEESVDVDTSGDVFTLRDSNGRIGVYTEEGYLIRLLNVSTATLPAIDREQLASGVFVHSWQELISLIEDLEG